MSTPSTATAPSRTLMEDLNRSLGSRGPAIARQARDREILRLREQGYSLGKIAETFGLTCERVRQICVEMGAPSRAEVEQIRAAQAEAARQALRTRALELVVACPGITLAGLAEALGADPTLVREALGSDARRLLGCAERPVSRVSDEELLDELRLAAELVGHQLTGADYDRIERILGLHSRVLMLHRFGTWVRACELAGVTPGHTPRDNYRRRWTRTDMLDWVARYLLDPGSRGTFDGYDAFARSTPGAPSAQTVRNEVGRWSVIKAETLRHAADRGWDLHGLAA